jgi:2-polyprenyl-6-methoxyphenol hydroxylase-like FAD-dependent oxidoreductase
MKAIVCGAGIAGLAAAICLARDGWDVLLIEKAPGLREEGYMIDFFGPGYDAASRLGLVPALERVAYRPPAATWVDRTGKERARLDYETMRRALDGKLLSLMRGDLERVLSDALPANVERRFDCSIAGISESSTGVAVTLTTGARENCDLLIGADGVHSHVRSLVFGPEENFFRYLGYQTAAFLFDDARIGAAIGGAFLLASQPGREFGLYRLRDGRILSVWIHDHPDAAIPAEPRQALKRLYSGMDWFTPDALAALDGVDDLYYDQVAQIEMEHWCKGRVALLGDAAYAVSLLAGQGASLAMAGAYVLADALRDAPSVETGLARYEARLKKKVAAKQKAGRRTAQWIAPRDRWHIMLRNWSLKLFGLPGLSRLLVPLLGAGSDGVIDDA